MEALLSMKNIKKSFSGVAALKNAELELNKGEVVALMGENGAGKSTLMKILTGIYSKDEGTITFEGKQVEYKDVSESEEAGIAIVHQELNMMNDLTVAQNVFIGRESKGFFCSDKTINKKCEVLIKDFGIDVKPTDLLKNLSVAKAQMVEIARAMSFESTKVLIMDEPTRGIDVGAKYEIYQIMLDLARAGKGIIMISSELPEVLRMSDRVIVMCEGRITGCLDISEASQEDIMTAATNRQGA